MDAAVSEHRSDIQGLRAIAVTSVMLYHSGLKLPGGFAGVDVFFVISGFVITAMLVRDWAAFGKIRFGRFYLRRFRRLIPALALCVVVTLGLGIFVLSPLGTQETAAKTGMGAILLVANVVIAKTTGGYFDAPAETNPLLHTWSLSIEEQFYLVFPALLGLALLGSRCRAKDSLEAFSSGTRETLQPAKYMVALVGFISFALTMNWPLNNPLRTSWIFGFYSPITRVWEFAAGAVLALSAHKGFRNRSTATTVGWIGLIMLLLSFILIDSTVIWPGPWTLLPVIGTVLLILAGARQDSSPQFLRRVLESSVMVKLGDWSYSLYLWHWPLVVYSKALWPDLALAPLAAVVFSFVPAVLSYYYVESPIRNNNRIAGRRVIGLVAITIGPALAVAVFLLVGTGSYWWSERIALVARAVEQAHVARTKGCDERVPLGSQSPDCEWNSAAPGRPVYLVGDSHAGHFAEGLILAGEELGRPVIVSTTNLCPFLDVEFVDTNEGFDELNLTCREYVAGSMEWLRSALPGTVVISNADGYWTADRYLVGDGVSEPTGDERVKERIFTEGVHRTVASLEAYGHDVVFVQTVPTWGGLFTPATCTTVSVAAGDCSESKTIQQAEVLQGVVRRAILEGVEGTNAYVWDSWTVLCDEGICSTQDGDMMRYRDVSHLSVPMSESLAPVFAGLLEDVADDVPE